MSNLFDTGSETVNRMCRLQFTGNVIPSTWYHTIKKETGKPNLNAIIILAALCTALEHTNSTIKALVTTIITALIGFFFYAVQTGLFN